MATCCVRDPSLQPTPAPAVNPMPIPPSCQRVPIMQMQMQMQLRSCNVTGAGSGGQPALESALHVSAAAHVVLYGARVTDNTVCSRSAVAVSGLSGASGGLVVGGGGEWRRNRATAQGKAVPLPDSSGAGGWVVKTSPN